MRKWIYENKADLKNTPSKAEGIPQDTEERYRREGAKLIIDVGAALKLMPNPTVGTAAVYFHRFYMFHSFTEFPRHLTALACLFLAGKVEETPKKCRDIIAVAREKLNDHHFAKLGRDPREEVMTVERVLLQTLKFDLQVELPYKFLLRYAKALDLDHASAKKLIEMAWTFVNDNLCTTLCLQWEPEIIAIAMLHLATKLSRMEIKNWKGFDTTKSWKEQNWWDQFVQHFDRDIVEDICHQVLDLYAAKPGASKEPKASSSSQNSSASTTPRTPSTTPSVTRPPTVYGSVTIPPPRPPIQYGAPMYNNNGVPPAYGYPTGPPGYPVPPYYPMPPQPFPPQYIMPSQPYHQPNDNCN